jgi:ADP-heptose:LPS heptosyltransferase
LQRDTGAEDVYQFPEIVPLHENHLKTFEETLAIISDLDIVITTCTSIAHASAAMGKRTYVFSPMSSYYVWCHSSKYKHSPWYAEHVTLLRQKRPRHWNEPIEELKQCLIGL